jgi:hypothetical protein
MKFKITEGCTSVDAYQLIYEKKVKIDLKKAANAISKIGEVFGETKVVLLGKVRNGEEAVPVSIYEDGRVLIKNIAKEKVPKTGEIITEALEKEGAFL